MNYHDDCLLSLLDFIILYNIFLIIIYSLNHYVFLKLFIVITSSTAQGGGGSFKNRKPIGDVGCCESGMAERSH